MNQKYVNPRTGQYRECPTGFSWASFFSTFLICIPLPPAARGHWSAFVVQFLVNIFVAVFTFWIGLLVMGIVWGATYNNWYIGNLQSDGFELEVPKQNESGT